MIKGASLDLLTARLSLDELRSSAIDPRPVASLAAPAALRTGARSATRESARPSYARRVKRPRLGTAATMDALLRHVPGAPMRRWW